jgi:hypothetical protein
MITAASKIQMYPDMLKSVAVGTVFYRRRKRMNLITCRTTAPTTKIQMYAGIPRKSLGDAAGVSGIGVGNGCPISSPRCDLLTHVTQFALLVIPAKVEDTRSAADWCGNPGTLNWIPAYAAVTVRKISYRTSADM